MPPSAGLEGVRQSLMQAYEAWRFCQTLTAFYPAQLTTYNIATAATSLRHPRALHYSQMVTCLHWR